MKTAKKIRLYTSLTILVISLVLAGTAGASTVNTPMTEDLDANSFDIYGVTNLDVDGDATVLGVLTGTEKITSVGLELLADPSFDDAGEWTGTGWTIVSSSAQSTSPGTLTEVNPFTVKANTLYLVEITVATGGPTYISLGGANSGAFGSGSYTFLIETTDTNSFGLTKLSTSFSIISDISVKEIGPAELGDTHVYRDLTVDRDLDVDRYLDVVYDVNIGGDLTVTDDANIGGDVNITGALCVDANLLVVDPVEGHVGINIATPRHQLHVDQSVGGELLLTRTVAGSAGQTLGSIAFGNNLDANLSLIVGAQDGDTRASCIYFITGGEVMRIRESGNIGIGTSTPTALLDIDSDVIRLRSSKTPSSPNDVGNTGDICWDSDYIYVCVDANTWTRAALSTW